MDTQQEHILQAVVLADPFEHQSRYGPLIRGSGKDNEGCEASVPFCLLPFLNTPLIAWTLESLSAGGVKNTFIIVRDGAKELQQWLDSSTFTLPTASMTITIRSTLATSEGDVMRELDALALTGNFLLTKAGFMGNLNFEQLVDNFMAKRKKDTGLLMDCIVAPRSRHLTSKISTHIIAPQANNQLLHYMYHSRFPKRARTRFPLELFEAHKDMVIRTDLESVGIDICNMEVPALFVENFDYQTLRPDFINGILTSDILGKSICCTILGEGDSIPTINESRSTGWAGIVGDLSSYNQMSKLVISRWAYPLVLDENVPGTLERYEQRRGRLYLGDRLNLSRSCRVGTSSVLGSSVAIEDASTVQNSIIGQNTRIGKNCVIENCHVWNDVVIEDGCLISNSIVGEGTRIGRKSTISAGTLIGRAVVIGEGAVLKHRRVATEPWDEEQGSQSISSEELGQGGEGYIWPTEEAAATEDQDSDDEDAEDPRNLRISALHLQGGHGDGYESSTSSISALSDISSSSSGSGRGSDDEDGSMSDGSDDSAPPAIAGIKALDTSEGSEQMAFQRECVHTLERSFDEGHTVENTLIELKTLRMASNVSLKKIIEVLMPFLVGRLELDEAASNKVVSDKVDNLISRWGALLDGLTSGQENGMVDVLLSLQSHCAAPARGEGAVHPKLFPIFLQNLYENDIVSEDGFIQWVKDPSSRQTGGEAGRKLWSIGTAFVKALMEADSDDDDEEDEDEDGEEDDSE